MSGKPKLLDGVLVVDYGAGMAAALAAKFLADNGARVVRIEPEGGDPFETYYAANATWRRGAERRAAGGFAPGELDALLGRADACILGGEDFPGLAPGPDAEALSARFPQLVILEIGGNPHGLPGEARPSTDLLAQARSGLCYEQYSDRPVAMAFEPASYGAAFQGLVGLLGALYERQVSGRGQIARTSLFQGALTWVSQLWGQFDRPSAAASALQPRNLTPLIFACRDGVHIHVAIGPPGTKYKLYQALQIDDPSVKPEDLGMPNFGDPNVRNFFGDIDLLSAHVAKFDSDELLRTCWDLGLAVEPVLAPGACWDHPQLDCNGVIEKTADGTRHVGNPVIARLNPAPKPPLPAPGDRALAGIRAVDFGAYVAGPLATVALADLGADVIKVEPLTGDSSRAMMRSYLAVNRGKRGIALDLRSAEGAKTAQALAASADIVANNFRGGVSERLGIDPATLHKVKPELITLESPGYGSQGPLAKRGAFDLTIQAFTGHEIKAAGEGNPPFWNRTYMVDFAGGMVGSLALLAALNHRARHGGGVSLETPLLNAGVFLLSEVVGQADGGFAGIRDLNASRTGYGPYEAMYKTRDGWLAIVARDAAARRGLLGVLGVDEGAEPRDTAARITTAVATRDSAELIAALEAAGVWVEVCRDDAETAFLNDDGLVAVGAVRSTFHPELGAIREIGTLFSLSRSKVGSTAPIHGLGEQSVEVLRDIGLSPARIAALLEAGCVRQAKTQGISA